MDAKIIKAHDFGNELAVEMIINKTRYSGCLTMTNDQRTKHCLECGSVNTKTKYGGHATIFIECLDCLFKACVYENYEQEEY